MAFSWAGASARARSACLLVPAIALALGVFGCSPAAGPERPTLARPMEGTAAAASGSTSSTIAAAPVEQPEAQPDLALPRGLAPEVSSVSALLVQIRRAAIDVDGETVMTLPPPDVAAREGVGAAAKRTGPNDLFIVPLGEALTRKRGSRTQAVLRADAATAFRVLIEVLFTMDQVGVPDWVLAIDDGRKHPPDAVAGWRTSVPINLGLNGAWVVLLVNFGYAVKLMGEHVGTGCEEIGKGVTVPKVDDVYDPRALVRCIGHLAPRVDRAAYRLDLGYISANPGVPYQEVVDVVHALNDSGVTSFGFKVPR